MNTNTEEEISEQIIKRICDCGWKAYLCGGAVRDEFLETTPSDFDIVTDALPEELEQIFPDKKVKTFGASFLVTTVDGLDVATYRSDKNFGPGRFNCITKACKTLDEDLGRRDFTFNALAVCPYTGDIVDPFGGKKDLERKLVKFVGNANHRIWEDPLRMIRAARFVCLIEGTLDSEAFNAICDNRQKVQKISPERIRGEVLKVMKYKYPSIFFDVLHDTGILKIIFYELNKLYGFPGGKFHNETLCTHFKLVGDNISPKDPILRFAGYIHDIGKPIAWKESNEENFVNHEHIGERLIKTWMEKYAFSKDEINRVGNLTRFHMRTFASDIKPKGVRRMLRKFSEYNFNWKDWFKLKVADNKGNLGMPDYTKKELKKMILMIHKARHVTPSGEFTVKDLPINGMDVMECMNILPGPNVGKILNVLLDTVVEFPLMNTKEHLTVFMLTNGEIWDQLLTD